MRLYLVRHGETEWTRTRRHTSRTDVALTPVGERQARGLGIELAGVDVDRVLASPMTRALATARLAGFGERVQRTDALRELDYGEYEGLTTPEIRARRPDCRPRGRTRAVAARHDRRRGRERAPVRARPRAARAGRDLPRSGAGGRPPPVPRHRQPLAARQGARRS